CLPGSLIGEIMTAYYIISGLLFFLLFTIWNRENWLNIFIKLIFGLMMIWALACTLVRFGFHKWERIFLSRDSLLGSGFSGLWERYSVLALWHVSFTFSIGWQHTPGNTSCQRRI